MTEKGCIIELREHTMVLMTSSCDFIEIPLTRAHLVSGMEIEFEQTHSQKLLPLTRRKVGSGRKAVTWIAVAALLMLAFIGGIGGFPLASAEPAYIVNIDLNPSLVLMLDESGSVIKVQALNEDAEMLNLKALRGLPMQEALSLLLREAENAGYLNTERDHHMVVSLLDLNDEPNEQVTEFLLQSARSTALTSAVSESLRVEVLALPASPEQAEKALKKKVNINDIVIRDAYGSIGSEVKSEEEVTSGDEESGSMEDMVRAVLKEKNHPVFEVHPGAEPGGEKIRKEEELNERTHPIFDVHPGQGNGPGEKENRNNSENDSSRIQPGEHPVYEVHPGRSGRGKGNV
jgi:hypothetical protein